MLISAALLVFAMSAVPRAPDAAYRSEIEQWRARREASLKSDDGWLTVAGLFWLKHGINTVGTDADNDIVLPAGSAPGKVGAFDMHDGIVSFQAAAGVNPTVDGNPATAATLRPDSSDSPDVLRLSDLTMFVIERGGRYGIRLKARTARCEKSSPGSSIFR